MPKKGPSRTALRKSSAKLMSVPDQRTHIRACVVTIYKRVAPGLCARYGDAFVEDEAAALERALWASANGDMEAYCDMTTIERRVLAALETLAGTS